MIKVLLIFSLALTIQACSRKTKTSDITDDYVLIEFAAKLEEDYQKIYPQPLEEKPSHPTE